MISLLLLGCGGGGATGATWFAEDFAGPEGRLVEFAALGTTQTELLLRVEAGWSVRRGERWGSATEVGLFEVRLDDGLWVGEDRLLPRVLEVGQAADGATVVAVGAHEAWYGTFDQSVAVEVEAGRWAGAQVFARDVGPVGLTLDGEPWDLVYYE